MDEAQRKAQIESIKEAITETEDKIASGETPSAGGFAGGLIPQPMSFETLLSKQKAVLANFESGA